MKIRDLVAGSAIVLFSAAPGFAQYSGNPPQVSTPAELRETRALNRNAQNGSYNDPAALNGETNASERSSDRIDNYRASLARYHQSRAQYDESRAAYQRAMARYRAERERWLEEQAY